MVRSSVVVRLRLSAGSRRELELRLRCDGGDRSVARRAQIVLWHDAGHSAALIAAWANTSTTTVYKWINRYDQDGVAGLETRKSPGRPRSRAISGRVRARILALSRQAPPDTTGLSRWTSRTLARYLRREEDISVSHNFVATLWRQHRIQPHHLDTAAPHHPPCCPAAPTTAAASALVEPYPDPSASVAAPTGFRVEELVGGTCVRPVRYRSAWPGTRMPARHP